MRVLIIEDDPAIAANLYDFLEARGHVVDAAADGVTGLHLAVTGEFDAIVLDLGLPGMDGGTLCRKLREEAHDDTPVLMLTARDTLEDKLGGFARGADDYIVKPFALREIEARLAALHKRRAGRVTSRPLSVGDLVFDPSSLTARFHGKDVKLPPKCIRLPQVMMAQPNRVFSRKKLEAEVWGEEQDTSDTLRSHMHAPACGADSLPGCCSAGRALSFPQPVGGTSVLAGDPRVLRHRDRSASATMSAWVRRPMRPSVRVPRSSSGRG